ncbi:MAG TPA: bifunctional UDP-N-acetylmuramoyl-tripeptide:D-alanyl-D-alanine ligase/alanine racemase [Bacteroidia bacterium]|nr:bifunctional UDP-N-acetylmuramoyl-tripeptide:D-alanyl-D-alanine ligase/alanine racemase [Bacteroidia bacterium]HNN10898.1 bifunctional UDP-N-acetylmuramoyl-tripeptide:D-alanyl-D-alanine ligase/alanine racemase [Bacteroidia bacterium]
MYTITEAASILKGTLVLNENDNQTFRYLLTDSRQIGVAGESLFFAIKGDRHDGHLYINDLIRKGVKNFVVSDIPISQNKEVNFIVVENTLDALQQLASFHRKKFNLKTIGITGSNGKTIIKEWLYQLLQPDFNIIRSPKSFNSQTGVPLSVWQINNEHNLGIFEAGISTSGEMQKLEKIIEPEIGVFSNVGEAHSENFTSLDVKIQEKLLLFQHSKTLIYCKDYSGIHNAVMQSEYFKNGLKCFTWSRRIKSDLQIGRIEKQNNSSTIQGIFQQQFIRIEIPFTDDASIENAIHCWAMLLFLEIEQEIIDERMMLLSPVAMRLEMKQGINNCSIINDSYNSDLGSLQVALDFLNRFQQHNNTGVNNSGLRKTVILSDILQSGRNEDQLYGEVAEMIHSKKIDRLIGIGPAISRHADLFKTDKAFFASTEKFIEQYSSGLFANEIILLKGARVYGFEHISRLLQQKGHETILEINLTSMIHNYNFYKAKLKPETKIMCMVKAFAYGSGSYEVANTLQFHRVDYLAVAYADEGIELRKNGITVPIMVMNPQEQSFDKMIEFHLEPEIYSFRIMSKFSESVKRNRTYNQNPFPIHLKMDTGMHRLGFEADDLNELAVRLKNSKHLKVESIFTHLAGTDEAALDFFTQEQFQRFRDMSDTLKRHFQYNVLEHVLNSSGISRFPEMQLSMVRLGIGLHGIGTPSEQRQLLNVASLKSTISQIRNVRKGESVGYNRKAILDSDKVIATIGIGYADGINRKMGNGKVSFLVNGRFAPTVGNICMDMCMLDITNCQAREGDEVIIFGNGLPVAELAAKTETIPYEILSVISQRVKRIYFQE